MISSVTSLFAFKLAARALLFLGFSLTALGADPIPSQVWHSVSGTTLEASVIAMNDGKVIFESPERGRLTVPLAQLAAAEQQLIKGHFAPVPLGVAPTVPVDAPVTGLPLEAGIVHGPVDAESSGAHYFIYVPKSLKQGRKCPLYLFTNSTGGKKHHAEDLREAAEITGWIIVVSAESDNVNKFSRNTELADACLQHVLKGYPVDPKRLYFGGVSGGGRMAFNHALKHDAAGVLGIVMGADEPPVKGRDYYFLNGANDPNRYFSARTYATQIKTSTQRFHPKGHRFEPSWMIAEGIIWLHGRHVQRESKKLAPGEQNDFEGALLAWAQQLSEKEPQRAYAWTQFLKQKAVLPQHQSALASLETRLAADPINVLYVAALDDLAELSEKVLAKMQVDKPIGHTDSEITRKVEALQKKYRAVPLINEILTTMAKPCGDYDH
jgi:hypothetical protein